MALLFCALGAIVARSAVDAVLLGIVVGRGLFVGLVVGTIALEDEALAPGLYRVVTLATDVVISGLGTIGRQPSG